MSTTKDSWDIDFPKTALLVIDMQRAWLDENAPREIPGARKLVPNVNKLAHLCRNKNIPVIFIREAFRPDFSDMGLLKDIMPSEIFQNELVPLEGKVGADFYPDLEITDKDYIVTKIRFSPFITGSSGLEPLLKGLNCDSIIISGCGLEICAALTAADAMQLGYKVFLIPDLTARVFNPDKSESEVLNLIGRQFAKLIDFKALVEKLERNNVS
jgi:ureidoacrylate peracid hydrolase